MTKRHLIGFFILLLCSSPPSLKAQQSISLSDCYTEALQQHPTKKQAAQLKAILDLQKKAQNRNYLPQLSLNGQASWQSDVTSIDIDIPIPGFEIEAPPKDQYRISLDLQQTIWDGGINKQQKLVHQSENERDLQQLEIERWRLRRQIQQLYFNALLAEQQAAQIASTRKELESKRSRLTAAIENGISIKSDLLRFDAKLIELEQKAEFAKQNRLAAIDGLIILTGMDLDENSQLTLPEATASSNQRPEFALFSAQKNVLQAQIKLVKVRHSPKFSLFAQGGYGRPALNMLAQDFDPFFIGGVRMQIPLSHFYNGQNQLQIKQLELYSKQIDAQKESFELQNNSQIAQLERKIIALESQIKTQEKRLTLHQEIKTITENQWKNGVKTSIDYLEEVQVAELVEQELTLFKIQKLQQKELLSLLKSN